MMEENVIPAIKLKWPTRDEIVWVQQDNAKPHSPAGDAQIQEIAAAEDGCRIRIKRQPPNSPDLNVLDLVFFSAIQALQHQQSPSNVDKLIECVESVFWSLKSETLDNTFLSLQQAMMGVLSVHGDKTYKLSHMGKVTLRRQGLLPVSIQCSPDVISSSREYLDANNAV